MDKGKEEEKIQIIKNLIKEGLETEFIVRVTDVNPGYVEDIRQYLKIHNDDAR